MSSPPLPKLHADCHRRKGLGEQASEKLTPDSQKSTLDKATEGVTGLGDRAAAAVQPGSYLPHPSLQLHKTPR
jgi:hypothetical protein